ncbi:hypothetical protein VTL71DRAFT_9392 [Oculimacula yallundae]|uniref:Uncharacterized protein n=1 Tax=Oculimacula yallundae TaxID=86028 RepID=A0ABR4BT28_9HELO
MLVCRFGEYGCRLRDLFQGLGVDASGHFCQPCERLCMVGFVYVSSSEASLWQKTGQIMEFVLLRFACPIDR